MSRKPQVLLVDDQVGVLDMHGGGMHCPGYIGGEDLIQLAGGMCQVTRDARNLPL